MDYRLISSACVALWIHSSREILPVEAEAYVRSALALRGLSQWRDIHIDLLPGKSGALLLASPAAEFSVRIADYALPFIQEYFTD